MGTHTMAERQNTKEAKHYTTSTSAAQHAKDLCVSSMTKTMGKKCARNCERTEFVHRNAPHGFKFERRFAHIFAHDFMSWMTRTGHCHDVVRFGCRCGPLTIHAL